jgi:hypothetical protein
MTALIGFLPLLISASHQYGAKIAKEDHISYLVIVWLHISDSVWP